MTKLLKTYRSTSTVKAWHFDGSEVGMLEFMSMINNYDNVQANGWWSEVLEKSMIEIKNNGLTMLAIEGDYIELIDGAFGPVIMLHDEQGFQRKWTPDEA